MKQKLKENTSPENKNRKEKQNIMKRIMEERSTTGKAVHLQLFFIERCSWLPLMLSVWLCPNTLECIWREGNEDHCGSQQRERHGRSGETRALPNQEVLEDTVSAKGEEPTFVDLHLTKPHPWSQQTLCQKLTLPENCGNTHSSCRGEGIRAAESLKVVSILPANNPCQGH